MSIDDIRENALSASKAMQLVQMLIYMKDEIALESPAAAICISIAVTELEKSDDHRKRSMLQ